ncbi:hypothetical protein CZ794_09980 [Psychrobacter sp. JB385]|nr:hypothetical protein CZ794_09980 [Psychrobacter sp. JB385]
MILIIIMSSGSFLPKKTYRTSVIKNVCQVSAVQHHYK